MSSALSEHEDIWQSYAGRRLRKIIGSGRGSGSDRAHSELLATYVEGLLEGVSHPPTDLDALMGKLGIEDCRVVPSLRALGELRIERGKLRIVLADGMNEGRRRFTIAHEIGHAIFERSGPKPPSRGRAVERFCDRIAAEVLFPKRGFLSRCDRQPDPQLVYDLAKAFNASISATAIRLTELTNASAFEVTGNRIPWLAGDLRVAASRGVLAAAREALTAKRGEKSGESIAYIADTRPVFEWSMKWQRMGESSRFLFIAHPLSQVSAA